MPEGYDLGLATFVAAQAIGVPGQRTFRLLVRSGSLFVILWLEKEQLQALAVAAEELIAQVGAGKAEKDFAEADPEKDFLGQPDAEFKIGQLGIGYDEEGDYFLLLAHEPDAEPESPPIFRCLLTRGQLGGLGQQAQKVCAAGRPRCVLCGQPLEPAPHLCPPSNGHASIKSE